MTASLLVPWMSCIASFACSKLSSDIEIYSLAKPWRCLSLSEVKLIIKCLRGPCISDLGFALLRLAILTSGSPRESIVWELLHFHLGIEGAIWRMRHAIRVPIIHRGRFPSCSVTMLHPSMSCAPLLKPGSSGCRRVTLNPQNQT